MTSSHEKRLQAMLQHGRYVSGFHQLLYKIHLSVWNDMIYIKPNILIKHSIICKMHTQYARNTVSFIRHLDNIIVTSSYIAMLSSSRRMLGFALKIILSQRVEPGIINVLWSRTWLCRHHHIKYRLITYNSSNSYFQYSYFRTLVLECAYDLKNI